MAVHGAAMAGLGYDLKWLLKESKILIRARVIKTAIAFAPEQSQPLEEGSPPPDVRQPDVAISLQDHVGLFAQVVVRVNANVCSSCMCISSDGVFVSPNTFVPALMMCTSGLGAAHCEQEQDDAGRGKRRRKSVLTPEQLAVALEGGRQSGSSSGSDFAEAAVEAAASVESVSNGDSDALSEEDEDEEPVEEPEDDVLDDTDGAARLKPAAKRCALTKWHAQ